MRAKPVVVFLALSIGALSVALVAWLGLSGALGYEPIILPAADAPAPLGHAWRGGVHVHTVLSGDASGTVEEVAAAAARAGLDFVVLSEHTRALGVEGRAKPGWYGDVLVVIAEEIPTASGHLLVLGVPPHPYAFGPTARQAVEDIAERGGTAILAHPTGGELAWSGGWAGVSGSEVVSYSDALGRSGWGRALKAALTFPASPAAAALHVFGLPSPAITDWDQRTRLGDNRLPRRLAAVGAVDAHGSVGWLGAPRYETLFESLSMLVWMDTAPEPGESRRRTADGIAEALAHGRSAIVLDAAGQAPAFVFYGVRGEQRAAPGDLVAWGPGWTLRATMGGPGPYRIVLLQDGEPITSVDGQDLVFEATQPATYRIEVYRTAGPPGGGRESSTPWVVSNPVYLWPEDAITASELHLVMAPPAPRVDADLMEQVGWAPENHMAAMSSMARGAEGIRWSLRIPDGEETEAYAALVWRPEQPVDWSAARGIAVRLWSADDLRVNLRLWTLDADGTRRTWERVVRSNASARGSGVRWQDFHLLEGEEIAKLQADVTVDLKRVAGLALVVTPARVKPRTETQLEILEIGTFGTDWP